MKINSKNKLDTSFNFAGMTDVIFLLLIFLLLSSTLINNNAIKVNLPASESTLTTKKNIPVTITPDLKYFIERKKVTPKELEIELQLIAASNEDFVISLNADKTVPIEYVIKVLDIANRHKFKMILATKFTK